MSRTITQIALVFVLLVLLILFNSFGILQKPFDVARVGVNFFNWPFTKVFEKVHGFTTVLFGLRDIVKQNEILARQVEELSGELASLEKAKSENKFLSEALAFQSESNFDLVPAEIISFDIQNVSQTVTLNRGKNDGIEVGEAVIVSKNILVGVITEVSDRTSQAELAISSRVKVNAEVVSSGVRGIVQGEHGLGLLFDLVSQDEVLNIGDMVVTSGLGGQFPKNLLIGEVSEIISGGPELFQKANIKPATNLRHNKLVFIIKK